MEKYIWLFPLLFIFHDMEEIIGFGIWLKKNKSMLDKKYPFISKVYENYSTEGMAFAVFEEFILCIIFCILTVITENQYVYLLWLGSFIAYTLHLVIHIGQSIIIRKYIPSLITSIICLQPAPIEESIVVSEIGEQWSPNIAPVKTALVLTIT